MTSAKVKRFIYSAVLCVICLTVWLLQSTGLATLKIGNASAVLIVPLTVLAGFYFKGYYGAVFGAAFGALTDIYSSTLCYNTIFLAIIGFVSGLLVETLFNSNLAAVAVLNVSASMLYFFVKWLVLYAFVDPAAGYLLVNYMLTSAVYTAAWSFVIYFVLNPFYKKMPVAEKSTRYDY